MRCLVVPTRLSWPVYLLQVKEKLLLKDILWLKRRRCLRPRPLVRNSTKQILRCNKQERDFCQTLYYRNLNLLIKNQESLSFAHVRLEATASRLYPIQGSYRTWKTWKVTEFKNFISGRGKSWNLFLVLERHEKLKIERKKYREE